VAGLWGEGIVSEFVTVARVGEIADGQGKAFPIGDRMVVLFHVEGKYYALDDYCPHMGAPLHRGQIKDGMVICDRHRWAFRLTDGTCPNSDKLRAETFEVQVVGEEIRVRVGEGPGGV
jgi:nitrite reductase (NADH) small subunit/3-phenylpropionate/trans-cinnamate dioxygenase ferredoxin subunit